MYSGALTNVLNAFDQQQCAVNEDARAARASGREGYRGTDRKETVCGVYAACTQ